MYKIRDTYKEIVTDIQPHRHIICFKKELFIPFIGFNHYANFVNRDEYENVLTALSTMLTFLG